MSAKKSEAESIAPAAPAQEGDQENDQVLHTALKKLKMDSERACKVTKEADAVGDLKHKHDPALASASREQEEEGKYEVEDCSHALQDLCMCDACSLIQFMPAEGGGAAIKQQPTCRRHSQPKAKPPAAKNSLNLALAAGVRKPVMREARLRFPSREKTKQVLRASRLVLNKAAAAAGNKGASVMGSALNANTTSSIENTSSISSRITTTTSSTGLSTPSYLTSASSSQPQADTHHTAASALTQAAFLSASSSSLSSFSALTNRPGSFEGASSGVVPVFEGYRERAAASAVLRRRSEPPIHHGRGSEASRVSGLSASSLEASGPSAVPSPSRLDLTMERSCSQEARLDEMSVNELAAYFEDFIHIPKKMSSMAEMMYT